MNELERETARLIENLKLINRKVEQINEQLQKELKGEKHAGNQEKWVKIDFQKMIDDIWEIVKDE